MARRASNPIDRIDERLRELEGTTDEQRTEVVDEQQVEQPPGETPSQEPQQPQQERQLQSEDENSTTYKQRWEALKGAFAGEKRKVEHLTEQVNALSYQMQQLREVQARPLASNATVAEIADHLQSLQEEYGEDYTRALRNAIRGEASQVVNEVLSQRLKPMEDRVEEVTKETVLDRRERFSMGLEARVKGWRALHDSPGFQEWLDVTSEKFSGKTYRQLFTDANTSWDMDRIAEFLNTYKQATGQATSQGDPQQPRDPREKLVAPGRSTASNPSAQAPQAKIWSMAEINQFYREVNAGRWAGREAEVAKMEADIDRANVEGRIR